MSFCAPTSKDGRPHTVIGAGTLGRRIALMWLTNGGNVNLFDTKFKALEESEQFIKEQLPDVQNNLVQDENKVVPGKLKLFTSRAEALTNAWLVTESVPEILQLKIDLLGDLDASVPADVIIATNSSSYTSTEMIEKVKNRNRIINMHYYQPPVSNPVEIMPNEWTHPSIADILVKEVGKHALFPFKVRKESIGLIANRVWAAIKRECLHVVADGISTPAEVDHLVQLALGFPRPPFHSMDAVGLDVVRDIELHYQKTRIGLPKQVINLLNSYISENKLGIKSGEGFFKHSNPGKEGILYYLDIMKGEIRAVSVSGKDDKAIVTGLTDMPDGIQIDKNGVIYISNMGKSPRQNDGSIVKINLQAGSDAKVKGVVETIVPAGKSFTPKQLFLDDKNKKLYWSDREGGRIQSVNLDGSNLETIYDSAPGKKRPLEDTKDWCVGITVDTTRNLLYWTQKGGSKAWTGKIFRANLRIPSGETAGNRSDIETLFTSLPEPIDLEIDEENQILFWTDRGDPPFGNTLNKTVVSDGLNPSRKAKGPSADYIIADHFHEAIGIALDRKERKIYVSDLLGSVYSTNYDGKDKQILLADKGNFSGITYIQQ